MKTKISALIALAALSVITACSDNSVSATGTGNGEGDGDGNPQATDTLTGVFLDSPVAGLGYSTNTLTGVTSATGEYKYRDGEVVTFNLFGQDLTPVESKSIVTPFDLAGADKHPDYAINMVRVLLSVDTDGDLSSIELPSFIGDINLNQSTEDFASDPDVIGLINQHSNTGLVSAIDAQAHIEVSFNDAGLNDGGRDLSGTTLFSRSVSTRCPDAQLTTTYTFTDGNVFITGKDAVDEFCVEIPVLETITVSEFMSREKGPLSCEDSVCSYAEMNRRYENGDTVTTINQKSGTDYATVFVNDGTDLLTHYIAFEEYRFNLTGKILDTVLTVDYCPSNVTAGYEYTFRETDFVRVGTDSISSFNCSAGESGTKVRPYVENDPTGDAELPCETLPLCTAMELNRSQSGIDGDDRAFDITRSHLPGSNSFKYSTTKGNQTFKNTLTIRQ